MNCTRIYELDLIVFILVVFFRNSLTDNCEQQPCVQCQNCSSSETQIRGSCQTQPGLTWPGPPSTLDIYATYQHIVERPHDKNYSNINIVIKPPQDSSINDVQGFQVEILDNNTGRGWCLTKYLSDCKPTMSQELYFCIESMPVSTFFVMVTSLPPPGTDHLKTNSISRYITIPFAEINSSDDMEDTVMTPLTYVLNDGTHDRGASVDIAFRTGIRQIPNYILSLVDHDRKLVRREKIPNSEEGQTKRTTFNKLCSGNYKIEIEPQNDESNCVCFEPEASHECGYCRRTHSIWFILNNTDAELCIRSLLRESPTHVESVTTTNDPLRDKTEKINQPLDNTTIRSDEPGAVSNPVIVVVIVFGIVVVVLIVAMLVAVFIAKYKRSINVPSQPTYNFNEYGGDYRQHSNQNIDDTISNSTIGSCSIVDGKSDGRSVAPSFHPGQIYDSQEKASIALQEDSNVATESDVHLQLMPLAKQLESPTPSNINASLSTIDSYVPNHFCAQPPVGKL